MKRIIRDNPASPMHPMDEEPAPSNRPSAVLWGFIIILATVVVVLSRQNSTLRQQIAQPLIIPASPSPTRPPKNTPAETRQEPTDTSLPSPTPTISRNSHIAYIQSVTRSGDRYRMSVIYAKWIESPDAPNGFRIEVPDNRAFTVPVATEPAITMQTYSHAADGNFNYNQSISLNQFVTIFDTKAAQRASLYWLENANGEVVKITEQYMP